MNRVNGKDLALVAIAGGLLAFELVSLGEALPQARKALAERGIFGKVEAASVDPASVDPGESLLPRLGHASALAGPIAAPIAVAPAKSAARGHAVSTASDGSKRCAVVTRAKSRGRSHSRVHVVTFEYHGSCAERHLAASRKQLRDVQKAVDVALKQTTL